MFYRVNAPVPTYRLVIGFLTICLIWGSTWLAMKEGLETVPPFISAAARFLVAIALLFGLLYQQKQRFPRDAGYWRLVAEIGVLMYGLPFGLIYWGQAQIPSGLSAVLFATYPFFVTLSGRVRIRGDTLDAWKIGGVLLGFGGVYVVFAGELSFDATLSPWGMAAIVLSAAMQAYGLITIKKRARDVHPVALTLGGMLFGLIFLLAGSIAGESLAKAVFDVKAIVSILYLAVFGTVVTFVTYFWLVKHMHPVLLSLTAFITPIVALTLGAFVRGEHLAPELLLGSALVLSGVLLANFTGFRAIIRDRLQEWTE